jgi:hypothetical protein
VAYFLAIGKLLSKDQPKKQKSETVSRKSEVDGNASQVDQRWIKGGSKVDQINRRFSQSTLCNEFFNN